MTLCVDEVWCDSTWRREGGVFILLIRSGQFFLDPRGPPGFTTPATSFAISSLPDPRFPPYCFLMMKVNTDEIHTQNDTVPILARIPM